MKLFCRDCGKNTKVRIEKSKNKYSKEKYFFCSECGVIVLIIYENK